MRSIERYMCRQMPTTVRDHRRLDPQAQEGEVGRTSLGFHEASSRRRLRRDGSRCGSSARRASRDLARHYLGLMIIAVSGCRYEAIYRDTVSPRPSLPRRSESESV